MDACDRCVLLNTSAVACPTSFEYTQLETVAGLRLLELDWNAEPEESDSLYTFRTFLVLVACWEELESQEGLYSRNYHIPRIEPKNSPWL